MRCVAGDDLCCANHGPSLAIRAFAGGRDRMVQFDAGPVDYAVEHNGRRLGTGFGAIEAVVLSHRPGITVLDRWRRTGAPADVTLIEMIDPDGVALLKEWLARLPWTASCQRCCCLGLYRGLGILTSKRL